MALRLSDEALAELDRPDGRFRACHGNATMPDALVSEVRALLQSLGVDAPVRCWVDGDPGVTARQELSNVMRARLALERELAKLVSSTLALHKRVEELEFRAIGAEHGCDDAAGLVGVLMPLVGRVVDGTGLTRADVAAAFAADGWEPDEFEDLFRPLPRPGQA
jgi:hypothetical protein